MLEFVEVLKEDLTVYSNEQIQRRGIIFFISIDTILNFRLRKCRQQKLTDAENKTQDIFLKNQSLVSQSSLVEA